MKTVKRLLPGLLNLLVLLHLSYFSSAQPATLTKKSNLNINSNLNGLLEILPSGYNPANTSVKYPLLILLQGIGSTGNGTDPSLQAMITGTASSIGNGYIQDQFMNNAWPDSYTVNGTVYKFIVLVPQFITPFHISLPTTSEVNDLLNYAVANYNVDTSRIYLMGNSSGGGIVWDYVTAGSAYANRVAAIIPFSGVSFPSKEKADIIRNGDQAVWAFHNELDAGVPPAFTQDYVSLINTPNAAVPQAKSTIFIGATGHDSWFSPMNRLYTENGMNIYEWMLQFSKTITNASAGNDQNITLPTSSAQLNAGWTDAGTTPVSYIWQQITGPNTAVISAPTNANPTVSGLVEGTYIFRVTITPNSGPAAYDDVAITVYPPRIEAENYTSMSGVTTTSTTDEGGGTAVNNITLGDYMDYNINVPAAGTYTIRFRVSSNAGPSQFVVKNAGGTVLTTVDVYWTPSWDTYATVHRNITLPAGAQVIRIESTDADAFNMNWLQLLSTGIAAGPLPLRFTMVNVSCANGNANISWATSDEFNTKEFKIEKSQDARTWTIAGTLPATGSGGSSEEYAFVHNNNQGFYRITAVDHDGRSTMSQVLKLDCGKKISVSLYPNPAAATVQLNINSEVAGDMQYTIIDDRGAVVLRQSKQLPAGSTVVPVDISRLSSGSYTLTARWNNTSQSVKFIKM